MSFHTPPDADFRPTASWDVLQLRAELLQRVRSFFRHREFLEVETPLLSADVVVDRHLDPFETRFVADPRQPTTGRRLFLQTSPEFAMKRLLAARHAELPVHDRPIAIYQITRAFRNGEVGVRHNPEFTIVEWYRTGDGLFEGMQLLSELCEELLATPPAQPLTYADAFAQRLQIDPHRATAAELAACAALAGIAAPQTLGDDRDAWLDLLLVECVEPHLGAGAPTLLHDYPASQAALAQLRDGDPAVGERFELYVRGVELANGYQELLDAQVLRQRSFQNNRFRAADGKPPLPDSSRLLAAMESGLPPCTGCALGFDRVVMLAAGADSLAAVTAFPIDRA